jgi:hypothetical protein
VVKVGDLVQAEIGGVLAFETPKRVRAIQDGWVFVEDHEAGIPMEQAQIVEKGKAVVDPAAKPTVDAPRLPLDPPASGWREERLLDDDGEEIFIRYKGDPTKGRYEFIRDYLDFKLKRLKPKD